MSKISFLEFKKKRNMAYFQAKNLCYKSLKTTNLRWQYALFFSLSAIVMGKLPVFENKNKKVKICAFLYTKLWNHFFRPSSWPVRAVHFGSWNFDRGLKTKISSNDWWAIPIIFHHFALKCDSQVQLRLFEEVAWLSSSPHCTFGCLIWIYYIRK